jgi:RNA recognition motif-containing protein
VRYLTKSESTHGSSRRATKLHVGNLTFDTTEADLQTLFAQQGDVKEATIVADRHSGRSRGFGFVEMASPEEAKTAIGALDGHNLDGRDLTVAIAKPRSR